MSYLGWREAGATGQTDETRGHQASLYPTRQESIIYQRFRSQNVRARIQRVHGGDRGRGGGTNHV